MNMVVAFRTRTSVRKPTEGVGVSDVGEISWMCLQRTNKKVRFFDEEIDKHWLCGCSPHILFKNSRSDLGPWDKVEDDEAKVEWDSLSQEQKDEWGFEHDLQVL